MSGSHSSAGAFCIASRAQSSLVYKPSSRSLEWGARSWQRALRARLLRDTWAHRFKPDAFGVCVRLSAAGAAGRRWSDTAPGLRLLGIFLHRAASWTTRTVCTDHACAAFSPASAFLASVSRAHLCRRRRCVFWQNLPAHLTLSAGEFAPACGLGTYPRRVFCALHPRRRSRIWIENACLTEKGAAHDHHRSSDLARLAGI